MTNCVTNSPFPTVNLLGHITEKEFDRNIYNTAVLFQMWNEAKDWIIVLLQLAATGELVKWHCLLPGRKPREAH